MGNTFFFKQAKENVDQISWRDIFSETLKKHTKEERDLALAAGTTLNSATEANMLSKWNKPFLWVSTLKYGLILSLLVYLAYYGYIVASGGFYSSAAEAMAMFLPPLVVPLVVMVFLWELNIPKNISLPDCIKWWFFGGTVSLTLTLALRKIAEKFIPSAAGVPPYFAPIFEEPAKLITVIIIIALIKKDRKIYGITGLVIGACVGAGFDAFESVGYAYEAISSGGLESLAVMFQQQFLRAWTSFGGHMLFCAPYAAALALHMKDSKFCAEAFMNVELAVTFIYSCLMHAIFNGMLESTSIKPLNNVIVALQYFISPQAYENARSIIVTILLWISLLWILRKCLTQVVSIGNYSHTDYVNYNRGAGSESAAAALVCTGGALSGSSWSLSGNEAITVGRDPSCKIRLPEGTRGISRIHCMIAYRGGWEVTDRNSSYGTYVNGSKLAPGGSCRLMPGDVISLADGHNSFTIRMN